MRNTKRMLSFLLVLALVVTTLPASYAAKPFEKTGKWDENNFSDVPSDGWFFANVKNAFELGLMKGTSNGKFSPEGSITLAETITIAARIHSRATTGGESFVQGNPWYQVYADYALANGIISELPADITRSATRLEFAEILSNALSADDLSAINTVDDGIIPDLAKNDAVYKLYRAGVLTGGDDKGTFSPGKTISRAEVSAIAARMALPETRIKRDLKKENKEDKKEDKKENKPTPNVGTMAGGGSSSRPKPQKPPKNEVSADVEVDDDGKVKTEVSMSGEKVNATVPAGVAVESGAEKLTLTVEEMKETGGNIETGEDETLASYDVHIKGVSAENTVAIKVFLGDILPVGMNLGNITLYHIENEETNAMTQVATLDELDAHNEFYYDPATGNVTVALASFSEIAVVAEEAKAWEGNFDYSWYTNAVAPVDGESGADYIIANADQLAAFGAIVGGMDGQTKDSFSGKTVKLVADVNLGDKESENNPDLIFYPIGYYNSTGSYEKVSGGYVTSSVSSFEGTFDGNGHTVKNFYQNTWEMFGDYNSGYSGTPNHYNDAKGLFGYVYNGTIKNLTVDNFSSDGEFTPTGVIAAYACNSTFENIAITNCNPRVYNTGNGGIVGIGGNSDDPDTYKLTFTNITIDNSNKITALWGSWDVACGGLVGMFRGAGHVYMTNCHVASQIDVYNDVCGNYQYYWYRYSGMMIGTNKNMVTDDAGYTVPETSKFHAENCTVHFGDWNDYYYCELVANSLASYTHDHQFSRLTQVDKVDSDSMTITIDNKTSAIPTSGRCNYVVVNGEPSTENATCYHFVDGAVWKHEDAGKETINGQEILKEDRQHYYLPFNQLFTGYGWGVKHIPVYNGEDYAFEGITILDREVADSVVKFEKADTTKDSYMAESTVTIGELFKAATIEDEKLTIKGDKVQVTVSPVDGSTAGGTYVVAEPNESGETDWTQGTLTFSGEGAATITITDYYFCTPTTITVEVKERVAAEKFESKFTGDFLYRVGNQNAVKLDSLFAAKDGVTVGTVSVTVENVAGNASGTYTSNATWTNGTIKFSGTGVVKVTITDNDYCTPTELYLEVVDATNLTSATGTTSGGNFVLLCDVNASNYVYYWNSTLYGNGFTYSLNGAPTNYSSSHGHGVLITKNATLDNLIIVGDVYDEYGAYTNNNDYNAAIDVLGDTVIQNCYISGCSAPVSTRANATIINTTLYGGAVANLLIKGGTVTLENVTTANYNDGRNAPIGMGIVVHSDASETAKLILNGTLTQYNFLNEEDTPTDTYAKNLHSTMFGSSLSDYHFGTSPNRRVNTGIVSLTATFNDEDITDNAKTGYSGTSVTLSGVNGYVYTQPNTGGSVSNDYDKDNDPHVATTQGAVPPSYSFDYTTKNYVAKTDGSNDYCYEENGKVNISMDAGDTFNWDTSILTATKAGQTLAYTVSMNGTDYTGKSIAFNTAGDYYVEYTYTDDNNYKLDENGNITTYSVTYTKTVNIIVAVVEAATKHAEFTMGSSNAATEKITIDNATYISATGVTADNSTWTYMTIDGQKIYYPIVAAKLTSTKGSSSYAYFPVFENVVTITDYADNGTGDAFTYNSSTTTLPSTLTAVKGIYKAASDVPYWYNLTNSNLTQSGASQIFKWASSSDAPSDPTTYNNVLCYKSPQVSADRVAYITLVQYSYTDATNTTYYYYVGYTLEAFTKQNTCFTPDTLITLADGSQKRIDEVTYNDEFIVWDFFNDEYTTAPASIINNHGYDNYTVVTLNFADGTSVNTINGHGFFDADSREFILLDEYNVADYVGHKFTTNDVSKATELVSYEIKEEYTESWSILTAVYYNCMVENMLAVSPGEVGYSPDYLMPFEVNSEMKFDENDMTEAIETYGLYTYEDFADVITREQFDALNLQYFKIAVGRGQITYDDIIYLLNLHMN